MSHPAPLLVDGSLQRAKGPTYFVCRSPTFERSCESCIVDCKSIRQQSKQNSRQVEELTVGAPSVINVLGVATKRRTGHQMEGHNSS
jgi:hypothetical protein